MARDDKKETYEILLTSIGIHQVSVKGKSPEDACQSLQRKIAGRPIRDTNISSDVVQEIWSDPVEKGEAWVVKIPGKSRGDSDTLMAWNGKLFASCDVNNFWAKHFKDGQGGD